LNLDDTSAFVSNLSG